MALELYISTADYGYEVAFLDDRKLVEFHRLDQGAQFNVGDLYLGEVRRSVSGLNATFVDIGYSKDSFLHSVDLGSFFGDQAKYIRSVFSGKSSGRVQDISALELKTTSVPRTARNTSRKKNGTDTDKKDGKFLTPFLEPEQKILVQVSKEPINEKGPRVSCEFSLPGRYIILLPFSNKVTVSKKIDSKEEKERLANLVKSILPRNFGAIVRTVSAHVETEDLYKDVKFLLTRWEKGMEKLPNAKPRDPIIKEGNPVHNLLRDFLNDSLDRIYVDDKELYESLHEYILKIAPKKEDILQHYKSKSTKLFHHYDIEKQIRVSFGKRVSVTGGGFIIIEHTEALHVIDVNSGKKAHESGQESNAINTNLEAVPEIALQIRLRDLGGIIIVDFIDMREKENRDKLFEAMKKALSKDKTRFTILPITRFGLLQITRHRVRPETIISTDETCPACLGTGKVESAIGIAETIEKNVEYLLAKRKVSSFKLVVHPYLHAFFTSKGFPFSKQWKWYFKYRVWIKVIGKISMNITDCKYLDKNGEEVFSNLPEEKGS
ncbi:MAG: Rne/Rng family ribonuclease [Cytophagales bacterium]|nr:Rne/Rng family ribonuclease [Cytophagales bacterium]